MEKVPGFDCAVNIDAVAEVLSMQYIGAPRTIYANVSKLPPGHVLFYGADSSFKIDTYFKFNPGFDVLRTWKLDSLVDELEDILLRSLRRRLVSDVPLGAFLSGGVDSSIVCAIIRKKLGHSLKTFSIGFKDAPESEDVVAGAFADHLDTKHHTLILDLEAAGFVTQIGAVLDEPNADSSCLPTYMLARFARQYVTVALSGDGGDEMFGGYGRYLETIEEDHHRAPWRAGDAYYKRMLVALEQDLEDLLGFVPDGFADHISDLRARVNSAQPTLLAAMRRSDVDHYLPGAVLPKVDRMSMQHSLEVRTPYLNVELARFSERLPDELLVHGGKGKLLLRELAYRFLPRELVDKPKQGFGLPMSDWARNSLLHATSQLLESEESRLANVLGRNRIDRFMCRQRSQGGFAPYRVWAVAMLESWLRHHPAKLPNLSEQEILGRRRPKWSC